MTSSSNINFLFESLTREKQHYSSKLVRTEGLVNPGEGEKVWGGGGVRGWYCMLIQV